MAASGLRAVKAGEKAQPPKSVSEAAKGTTRELLVALRDRLAKAIEDPKCPPRDLASLSRRLHEITRDIESIDSREGGDDIGAAASTEDEAFDAEAL